MLLSAYYSFGFKSIIALGISFITFCIFIFFIFPIIKNQVVDVEDNYIILYSFKKGFELDNDDLTEVINRWGGLVSYRFKKGSLRFQISPLAYYNGAILEKKFSDMFSDNKLKCRTRR